jgi:hypothetical protein
LASEAASGERETGGHPRSPLDSSLTDYLYAFR